MNLRPVFVIGQDTAWCARVCRFLEPQGIHVIAARDLDTAVHTAEQVGKPGALVMDMSARATSDQAISSLRKLDAFRDVPVGYIKKSAALEALLLMVTSGTAGSHQAA